MKQVVVVGAGIGGLTSAAVLARAGIPVTVLEAHVYPGGCAGTFYHQGYRFDAGATLAGGFYAGGPMDLVAREAGVQNWPVLPSQPAMIVHMPDNFQVTRWGDDRRFAENRRAFGEAGIKFFEWQEKTADAMWSLALRSPSWPPQTPAQLGDLLRKGVSWLAQDPTYRLNPGLLRDMLRPVYSHIKNAPGRLRLFVDAQLLISAQAIGANTNALYAASALDLPRRGVVHPEGGMGSIAETLAHTVRSNGGQVNYRKEVTRIRTENGRVIGVELKRGDWIQADAVIVNLPPWNIARFFDSDIPSRLKNLSAQPKVGWGAYMVYIGLDGSGLPGEIPLHHQVIVREPLGEGNTIFISISPDWDTGRAPPGKRALTISTHTAFHPWWELYQSNPRAYEDRKWIYTERLLHAASRVIPDIKDRAELIIPGTPVSFERFTRRVWGWVGGFPQTNLFTAWGPRLANGLWMVGDSIFPGQSTAAVALGGLRVARDVQRAIIGVAELIPENAYTSIGD